MGACIVPRQTQTQPRAFYSVGEANNRIKAMLLDLKSLPASFQSADSSDIYAQLGKIQTGLQKNLPQFAKGFGFDQVQAQEHKLKQLQKVLYGQCFDLRQSKKLFCQIARVRGIERIELHNEFSKFMGNFDTDDRTLILGKRQLNTRGKQQFDLARDTLHKTVLHQAFQYSESLSRAAFHEALRLSQGKEIRVEPKDFLKKFSIVPVTAEAVLGASKGENAKEAFYLALAGEGRPSLIEFDNPALTQIGCYFIKGVLAVALN